MSAYKTCRNQESHRNLSPVTQDNGVHTKCTVFDTIMFNLFSHPICSIASVSQRKTLTLRKVKEKLTEQQNCPVELLTPLFDSKLEFSLLCRKTFVKCSPLYLAQKHNNGMQIVSLSQFPFIQSLMLSLKHPTEGRKCGPFS